MSASEQHYEFWEVRRWAARCKKCGQGLGVGFLDKAMARDAAAKHEAEAHPSLDKGNEG